MENWHDKGISIAVDVGAIAIIIALMMHLSTDTTQGQLQAFGLGLLALFFSVSIIQEIADVLTDG